MPWDLALKDWEKRLRKGESLIPELPIDEDEGQRAVNIFNKLRLPDVVGKPLLAEAAGDWFRDIVRTLFGAWDGETRHIREVFCLVPKKNSKTTNGAALMVTALVMNSRPRAEFLLVGPTQAVSDLAFSQAIGMIEADDYLRKRYQIREHIKEIKDRLNGAKLKIKTFDAKVLTGVKPVGILIDELHEIGKSAHAANVIGQLRGGLMANPEGFLVIITTQSDSPPSGVFRTELMKARAIRDGRVQGTMLPVLYEFPEAAVKDGRWRDPSTWATVSPNLDRSITLKRLEEDWEAAQQSGEEEIRRWASQHLNIEIGLALQSDRWAGADHWEAQARPLTLEEVIERAEVLTIGIDGGGLDDLLGLTVLGRTADKTWLSWSRAWAHSSVFERRKAEAARMHGFIAEGDLVYVETLGNDIADVVAICAQVDDSGKLDKVGVDPVGIGAIVDALAEEGISGDRVVGITQGWKMTGAIKTSERKLADGTLIHADQKLMNWCVGNAKVEPRGNAIIITKQAAGSAKIDPLMAHFNAVALMAMNPEAAPKGRMADFLANPLAA